MKVSIGSDHRGLEQRKIIAAAIEAAGHEADDRGTNSTESVDYPEIAFDVAAHVASGNSQRGILLCGTGIGMSIAANKVDGIRAAVCWDLQSALLSRQHNDANVLSLSGESFSNDEYQQIITQWLSCEFDGGRHARRVDKIMQIEQGTLGTTS